MCIPCHDVVLYFSSCVGYIGLVPVWESPSSSFDAASGRAASSFDAAVAGQLRLVRYVDFLRSCFHVYRLEMNAIDFVMGTSRFEK